MTQKEVSESIYSQQNPPIQAQVEQAVRYMKYPSARWPQGVRGAGTIFAPPTFHQSDEAYFESANDNVIFIAQVESKLGVERCEEIAGVDGVGMFSFSLSLRYPMCAFPQYT